MPKKIALFFYTLLSIFAVNQTIAKAPWFTGPLLAESGKTIPAGQANYEAYFFHIDDFGHFDNRWKKQSKVPTTILNPDVIIIYGLNSCFDLEVFVPFVSKKKVDQSDAGFGDMFVALGYQLLRQKSDSWVPNLRLILRERLPTGRYQNLDPAKKGTDVAGFGSYQTVFGINIQKLWALSNGHFLRARLDTKYGMSHSVRLHGFNTFGGGFNTNGRMRLGNYFKVDLAFEYTLTQHWVPAIDFLFINMASNNFTGNMGTTSASLPAMIFTQSRSNFSIAPAIEYNFTRHLGIIVGSWFTIAGRNSSNFKSVAFALNYFD